MRLALPLAALTLLAACGRETAPSTDRPEPAAPAPVEATAVDEFGPLGGEARGAALWAHPTLNFNGLVIATGAFGLAAYNVEDGAEVARVETGPLEGAALAYIGSGPSAQAYLAARGEDGEFRFFAIDNRSRAFAVLNTVFVSDRNNEAGFCLGRPRGEDALALYEMRDDGWRMTRLAINGDAVSAAEAQTGAHAGGFIDCVADNIDGAVFAITAAGDIHRIENGAALPEPLAATGVENAAGIGLALNGLVEGGATDECCGQIAVLDGESGVVSLYDREDGHALGAVRLSASFDVEGVEAATALAFGYGNFGAIYRDGLLVLATAGEAPSLRVTPLNGVMDALGQPLGETADPRGSAAYAEDDATTLDLDLSRP